MRTRNWFVYAMAALITVAFAVSGQALENPPDLTPTNIIVESVSPVSPEVDEGFTVTVRLENDSGTTLSGYDLSFCVGEKNSDYEYLEEIALDGGIETTGDDGTATYTFTKTASEAGYPAGNYHLRVHFDGSSADGLEETTNLDPLDVLFDYSPVNPYTYEVIEFDASDFTGSDNYSVDEYNWDWTNDGTYETTTDSATVTHSYGTAGTYEVTLEIDDGSTTDEVTQEITVRSTGGGGGGGGNTSPTADFSVATAPGAQKVKNQITFDASDATDPDGDIESYDWDFGDGNTATGQQVTHVYSENGTYTIELTVTDDDGATDTATMEIEITYHTDTIQIENPGWAMVSPPLEPADKNPAHVFEGVTPQSIAHYDPGAGDGKGQYLTAGTDGFQVMDASTGSWIKLDNPKTFEVEGVPLEDGEIDLQVPGWHQVSVPMDYTWKDIGVRQGADGETMTVQKQADGPSAPHWTSRFIWAWDTAEEEYVAYDAESSEFSLKADRAYWVRTREEDVTLIVPFGSSSGDSATLNEAPEGVPMNSTKAEKLDLPQPPVPPKPLTQPNTDLVVSAVPNPATSTDNVTFNLGGVDVDAVRVSVFNPSGETIYQSSYVKGTELSWNTTKADGSQVPNGLYVFTVEAKKGGEVLTSDAKTLLVLR